MHEFLTHAKAEIVKGIFWAIGASIGFALVSTLVISILSNLDTLPIIGDFIASLVEETQSSLDK